MYFQRNKHCVLGVLTGLMLSAGLFTPSAVQAAELDGVNTGLGITYIYSETDATTPTGINLNGNSVIIEKSANSTTAAPLINFYIDKDKDGVLDADETVESVGGAVDVNATLTIYGVYQQKSTEKLVITVKSGAIKTLRGVYGGEIATEDATAIAINLNSSDVSGGNVVVAEQSTVSTTAENAVLIDMNVTAGLFGQLLGGDKSDLDAGSSEAVAFDFDFSEAASLTGMFAAAKGDSSDVSMVRGSVKADVSPAVKPEGAQPNFAVVYQLWCCEQEGNFEFHMSNATVGAFPGLYESKVTGDYISDVDASCNILSTYLGMYNSSVDGDATISWVGCSFGSSNQMLYGINGRYQSLDYMVSGDCNLTYHGGYAMNLCGINGLSAGTGYIDIGGDVTFTIKDGTILGQQLVSGTTTGDYIYALRQADVNGNVAIAIEDGSLGIFNSGYNMYGLYNVNVAEGKSYTFNIGKDVTAEGNEGISNTVKVNVPFYAAYYSNLKGNANAYVYSNNASDNLVIASLFNNTDIDGDVNAVVKGGCYSEVYGVQNSDVNGNVDIALCDINEGVDMSALSYNTFAGVYSTPVTGNVSVVSNNVKGGYLYGIMSSDCGGKVTIDFDDVEGNALVKGADLSEDFTGAEISFTNVVASGEIDGLVVNSATCTGDIICNLDNVSSSNYLYGVKGSSLNVTGDVASHILNSSAGQSAYCVTNADIEGNLDVSVVENGEDDVADGENAVEDIYQTTVTGATNTNATGVITVNLEGITTKSMVTPYGDANGSDNGDVTVTIKGLNHACTAPINNETAPGQELIMTITDSIIAESVSILPGSADGGVAKAIYGDVSYYTGQVLFENDEATEGTIYLCQGTYHIPAGVTVGKESSIILKNGADVLLEGALDGTVTDANGALYVNGGTTTSELSTYNALYYPLNTTYSDVGGTVSTSSTRKHAFNSSVNFAKRGSTVSYTVNSTTGYSIEEVTVITNGGYSVEVTDNAPTYSFVMPDDAATFDVVFGGQTITLGKTVPDPVVIIGQTYDASSPVYDLSSVVISNDDATGTVTYAIDETKGLPDGLSLEGTLIVGTIPEGTEEGVQESIIHVTGKNGSTAELSLKFTISTDGEGGTTEQDGRIMVNTEDKEVHLYGNSVIFKTHADGTAIYLDDDQNGIADYEEAAWTGDLTEYAVYGVHGADINKAIKLTVEGGTIGKLYAAYGNNITNTDLCLDVSISGGSIGEFYALNGAKASGTMKIVVGEAASITTYAVAAESTDTYKGYYSDNKGDVTIAGTYAVDEEVNAKTISTVTSSAVTFMQPVIVTGDVALNGTSATFSNTVNVSGTLTVSDVTRATFNESVDATKLSLNASEATQFKKTVTVPTICIESGGYAIFNGNVESTLAIVVYADATAEFNGTLTGNQMTLDESSSKAIFKKDVNISSKLSTYGEIWINEGVTVTVPTLYKQSSSETYLKGNLNANGVSYSGNVYMMEGSSLSQLTSGAWSYVFYPFSTSTDMKGASVTIADSVTVEGATYLRSSATHTATATQIPGYEYTFKVNGENIEGESFVMPNATATIVAVYSPIQITLTKSFAEPTGSVGATYTANQPLYDLSDITINNDTTDAYGGEVIYAVNSESVLPAGLTLENGKVIGTPTTENALGDVVKFDVTGRNGTTATIEVLISILAEGYEPVDINDTIEINSTIMNLKGTSIVIYPDESDSSMATIYPDYNGDGKPDNNIPLEINGETSYSLASYSIYGYMDTETPYMGNISIIMLGGKVKAIYGVYGSGSTTCATVNGNVTVHIVGGTISTNAYGSMYGKVSNVELKVTDGTHNYADFYGAVHSQVSKDVCYECGGTAIIKEGASNQAVYIQAAKDSTVGGNVDINVGFDSSEYGFTSTGSNSYYSRFKGVCDTAVQGDVNVTIDGYWAPKYENDFVSGGSVAGDVNINWKSGIVGVESRGIETCFANGTTITGSMNVTVADGATIAAYYDTYALYNATAENVNVYVPTTASKMIYNFDVLGGTSAKVNDYAYSYNRGYVQIGGEYTITEDLSITSIYILEGAQVTIAEGTSIGVSGYYTEVREGATLVNNGELNVRYEMKVDGTFDNRGSFKNTAVSSSQRAAVNMREGSKVINREGATWNVAGEITNGSAIYNYGEFVQTYEDVSLGTMFTVKKLSLQGEVADYTEESNLYYPYSVDYPTQCVDGAPLTGDSMATSDLDEYSYIEGGSTFSVTPGTQLVDTVELASITYGTDASATKQENGTWIGTAPFEPFTVTLNYEAKEEVSSITLNPTAARIDNTEQDVLVVNKEYTAEAPLYDLTTIQVLGDTATEGNITYSVESGSSLPEGLVLQDGKLYGILKNATENEQTIKFVVKGKNQTSAVFTLTLCAVKKCVPEWSVPTGFTAVVGQTFGDVQLPTSEYGTYSWRNSASPVGEEAVTLENVELLFAPNDIANYDWGAVAQATGGTYADGVVTFKVSISIGLGVPTYTVPIGLTATYGQTFGEVEIPAGTNDGVFTWSYNESRTVGNVGEHQYYVTYTPNNKNYQEVTGIKVTLTVNPAIPTFTKIEALNAVCGMQLKDITLPTVVNGTYKWITTADASLVDGKSYQLGFVPTDTTNYDWTALTEWNSTWDCIVFAVSVNVDHEFEETWTYDETYHWNECLGTSCTEIENKATHNWGEGEVKTPATETTTGIREYTCECGATKEETIPVTTHKNHTYGGIWKSDAENHWKECTFDGCNAKDQLEAHTWNAGVVTEEATETTIGVKIYTCTACNRTKTETIPMLEHTHSFGDAWESDAENHWKECTSDSCDEKDELGEHTWNNGVVIKEATETTTGVKTYTCTVCSRTKTEIIPILDHTHIYGDTWESDVQNHWKECTSDSCDEKAEFGEHTWDTGVVTKEATETSNGETLYTCTVCSKTKTEITLALGEHSYDVWDYNNENHWKCCGDFGCSATTVPEAHDWGEGVVKTPATETTTGVIVYTCECGKTKREVIPVLEHTNHTYGDTWKYDAENHWKECTFENCEELGALTNHTWDEGVITKEATATVAGERIHTCTICKVTKVEIIPATGVTVETPGEKPDETPDESPKDTPEAIGTVLEDDDVDGEYKVTNDTVGMEEVSYKITNKSATKITIPDTIVVNGVTYKVTSIADNAFKNHKKLKTVKMGANVVTIGKNAFSGCKKLTTVTIGKNVTTIGNSTFQNCTALKKITIPAKVTKIGTKAFYGCKKLTSITIKTAKLTTKNVGKNAFKNAGSSNYKKLVVKVPKKQLKSYTTMLKKRGLSSKAKVKK